MKSHGKASGGTVAEVPRPVAGRTALIVEDDLASAVMLKAVLERARINVVPAADGRTALDALDDTAGQGIGIVLMDIKMPGIDGYDTIAAIRKVPRFARLPIVALTAKEATGERERCLAAGASDFISKPIHTPTLLKTLDRWMTP